MRNWWRIEKLRIPVNSLESLLSEIIVTPTISDLSIEEVRQKVEEHFKSAQRHTTAQQARKSLKMLPRANGNGGGWTPSVRLGRRENGFFARGAS